MSTDTLDKTPRAYPTSKMETSRMNELHFPTKNQNRRQSFNNTTPPSHLTFKASN